MKLRLPLITTACLVLSNITFPAHAAQQMTDKQLNQLIQKVTARTEALENQISFLKNQIKQYRTQTKTEAKQTKQTTRTTKISKDNHSLLALGATPVLSSPYLNLRKSLTTTSTPIKMLEERKKYTLALKKENLIESDAPQLEVGGSISGAVNHRRPYRGAASDNLALSSAQLGIAATVNPWVTGLINFAYDPSPSKNLGINRAVSNSRVILNRGFVTLGNLTQSPFYASIGQMGIPFGDYNSSLLTAPMTARLGRMLQRAVLAGYTKNYGSNNLHASIFTFRGDSRVINQDDRTNGGFDLNYLFKGDKAKVNFGLSWVRNIADSGGMQDTGSNFIVTDAGEDLDDEEFDEDFEPTPLTFAGFGKLNSTEIIEHRVAGLDLRSKIELEPVTIQAEYTGSIQPFATHNLSFNDAGARPRALNVEAAYKFKWLNRETTLAAGYGLSREALALNIPEQRYSVALRHTIWKNLKAGLEYRHDMNYGVGNSGEGQGLESQSERNLGRVSDSVALQLSTNF